MFSIVQKVCTSTWGGAIRGCSQAPFLANSRAHHSSMYASCRSRRGTHDRRWSSIRTKFSHNLLPARYQNPTSSSPPLTCSSRSTAAWLCAAVMQMCRAAGCCSALRCQPRLESRSLTVYMLSCGRVSAGQWGKGGLMGRHLPALHFRKPCSIHAAHASLHSILCGRPSFQAPNC